MQTPDRQWHIQGAKSKVPTKALDFTVEENEMDMSKTKPFLFIPMTHDFNVAGPCTNPRLPQIICHLSPIPNPHSRIQTKTRTAARRKKAGVSLRKENFVGPGISQGAPLNTHHPRSARASRTSQNSSRAALPSPPGTVWSSTCSQKKMMTRRPLKSISTINHQNYYLALRLPT